MNVMCCAREHSGHKYMQRKLGTWKWSECQTPQSGHAVPAVLNANSTRPYLCKSVENWVRNVALLRLVPSGARGVRLPCRKRRSISHKEAIREFHKSTPLQPFQKLSSVLAFRSSLHIACPCCHFQLNLETQLHSNPPISGVCRWSSDVINE